MALKYYRDGSLEQKIALHLPGNLCEQFLVEISPRKDWLLR
jgi:hypothetical protein